MDYFFLVYYLDESISSFRGVRRTFSFLFYHTCDKFQRGFREIFLSFQGDLWKMYRIYRNIFHGHQGDFSILVKSGMFLKKLYGSFQGAPWRSGRYHMYVLFLIEIHVSKQWRPWSDAAFWGVWSGSALFAYVLGTSPYNKNTMQLTLISMMKTKFLAFVIYPKLATTI